MINYISKFPRSLRIGSYILIGLYVILIICWLTEDWLKETCNCNLGFSLEATVFIMGLAVSGVNVLLNKVIEELEYSPAHALSVGYFNFIDDVVSQLVENGIPSPKICIYRPTSLDDISPKNIDLLKAQLTNASYNVDVIKLTPKGGRARDVIILQKDSVFESYFDIPNTLLSLYSYVEYKIVSKENSSQDNAKAKLVSKLIDEFYEKFEELIKKKDNTSFSNIDYCDRQMTKFLM